MGYVLSVISVMILTTIAEFDVHQVHEIDWNADSFDTLVLPDGYKDLIIAHVESQLKKGENFDDVISGKGRVKIPHIDIASILI